MAKNNVAAMEEYAADASSGELDQGILEYSSNIEDAEKPPVLPIGEYRATVVGVEKKFGKDSGRPYINVKWRVSSDNMPADYVEAMGVAQDKTLFGILMAAEDTPPSRYAMKQFCKAIGAPMSNRINVADFVNREAKIQIKHGKDLEGNPQEQVGRVLSAE